VGRVFRRDEELLGDDGQRSSRATFEPVASEAELDEVFAKSVHTTALLFLHDPYCPISSMAYEEVEQLEGRIELLDVAENSALGRSVEVRTGIRHESPQAIVLRRGVPTWHASHRGIRAEALREALRDG
jgi:bacillithiol system protein YtxJ